MPGPLTADSVAAAVREAMVGGNSKKKPPTDLARMIAAALSKGK